MLLYNEAAKNAGSASRAGILGVECLRELCLLCGGIAVVMGLLHGAGEGDNEQMTTAMRAGAAAAAHPEQPIYRICLQANQHAAWVKRGDANIEMVSLVSGKVLDRIPVFDSSVSASGHSVDGRVHACATNPGGLTIVRDGVAVVEEPHAREYQTIVSLSVTADGSRVAAADDKFGILMWDLTGPSPSQLELPMESSPIVVAWSADGTRILVGCGDGRLAMYSSDGSEVWSQKRDLQRVSSVAWSPDGTRVAAGQYGGDLAVLAAAHGEILWRSCQDSIQISAVSFSPDGERLAVSGFDRTVDVLSASTGRQIVKLPGHYDMVRALQFLPDGDRILSGSLDGTLRIWSVGAGRELQKM